MTVRIGGDRQVTALGIWPLRSDVPDVFVVLDEIMAIRLNSVFLE
jgi:hypothetical protein